MKISEKGVTVYYQDKGEWLKDVKIADKPYKIAICHDTDFIHKTDERNERPAFINHLNESGIRLMLGGHLHEHYLEKPGTDNKEYYTFIDGGIRDFNYKASQITVSGKSVTFKTVDQNGNEFLSETADIFI